MQEIKDKLDKAIELLDDLYYDEDFVDVYIKRDYFSDYLTTLRYTLQIVENDIEFNKLTNKIFKKNGKNKKG